MIHLPNFLIIGAAKAGTTALYHLVRQHPDIYMSPVKEPNFFSLDGEAPPVAVPGTKPMPFQEEAVERYRNTLARGVSSLSCYQHLFAEAGSAQAVGEASPLYLYHPGVPARIRHYLPAAKLIAVLRNPIERAYSHFLQRIRDGQEPLHDFEEALQAEPVDVEDAWWGQRHYIREGFYSRQLRRYFECFPRQQIRIYLYEDFQRDPAGLLRDLMHFLEVDEHFGFDMAQRYNVSGLPLNERLHRLVIRQGWLKEMVRKGMPGPVWQRTKRAYQRHALVKPPLEAGVRSRLVEVFREDVLQLQEMLGRDLSAWREGEV